MAFTNRLDRMSEPAHYCAAISTSDTVDLPLYSRGIFVGVGGDVALKLVADDPNAASVVFKNCASGQFLPFRVRRVYATSTTATNLVAVW